ncbi:MAG: pentapeptide repeat-containing protein [bacterium]
MFNLKKYLFFIFIFFQSNSFAMLDEAPLQVPYDEVAFERLKAFGQGERPEVNHFASENLKGIELEDVIIKNGIFNDNRFDYSQFVKSSLEDGSKILNSNLNGTRFDKTIFDDSDIQNCNFVESKIMSSIFDNFVIFNSDFSKSFFLNCRFSNMVIDSKNGKKCFVSDNNFSSSLFKYCTFRGVGFRNNNFTKIGIENSSFKDCIISEVDFYRASFNNVIFENCTFINCKSMEKMFFTGNVIFNFCEFIKTDDKKNYIKRITESMENRGASVIKIPGKWEEFKAYAGAFLKITSHVGASFLTAGVSEYARSVISDCNKACTAFLNQKEQLACDINT